MKFHGRLHPGRLLDLATPAELHIHQPARCAGVTIEIWELDAYLGADGTPRREGTPDDLLATFTGSIQPNPRRFVVAHVAIEPAPPGAVCFLLAFPGSPARHEIPIRSEDAEVEGTDYELGFSIEVGGSEKFRTRVPCLLSVPTIVPRLRERLILGFDGTGAPLDDDACDLPTTAATVTLAPPPPGFDDDSDDPAMFSLLLPPTLSSAVTAAGHLLNTSTPTGRGTLSVGLRRGKPARAFVSDGTTPPPTSAAALSHPVAEDGTITLHRVDVAHVRTLLLDPDSTASVARAALFSADEGDS